MTQLHKSMNILSLQKQLLKKQSHIKEALKIQFIKEVMHQYRQKNLLPPIDFEKSIYENNWNLEFKPSSKVLSLPEIVSSVMEKWYFSNLSKNENIYFYRFLNVFRSLMTGEEWIDCENYLLEHSDLILRENTRVYCDYRRKLGEIEQMIQGRQ